MLSVSVPVSSGAMSGLNLSQGLGAAYDVEQFGRNEILAGRLEGLRQFG